MKLTRSAPARLQVLRRADRLPDRAGPDRRGRAERLRQVEPGRSAALGDGRDLAQVDARRRDGRRDLRRHQQPAGAQHRRSRDPDRQRQARGAGAVQRARDARRLAPDRAREGLALPHQRPRGARARREDPVRRRLDRLALARAGASGPHRRDHPGQARAAPPRAGRSRRHFRPACAPPRGRAAAEGRRARTCCASRTWSTQLAGQIDALKRQARQAVRYRNVSAEVRKAEATLFHLRWLGAQCRSRRRRARQGSERPRRRRRHHRAGRGRQGPRGSR